MNVTKFPGPSALDDLAKQADNLNSQQPDPDNAQPGQAAPLPMTNAQALGAAFELVRETLCIVANVQSPRTTLATDKLQPIADAWGAVCDKRGISLVDMLGDYILELKALGMTVPLFLVAKAALAAEIADKKSHGAHRRDGQNRRQ